MNIQRLPLPFFVVLMISLTFGVGCVEESAFDDEPGDAIVYEQALRANPGVQTQRSGCYVSYDFDGSEGDLYEQEQWAHELLEANPNEKPMMVIVGQDMTITFSRDYEPVEPKGDMPAGVSKRTDCDTPASSGAAQLL